jgi:hypothetical protein
MPELREVSYSREATIAAFRDYYQFLIKMYLPESMLEEPPAGGWPSITNENVHLLGKNDEVAELMRHLPYISENSYLAPHSEVAHWPTLLSENPPNHHEPFNETEVEDLRLISEDLDWENVPPSAFGILFGKDKMVLDTRFGVIHWVEGVHDDERQNPSSEGILGDFWDCTPENEHEWRCAPAWAIVDFFELLKKLYRELKYVPIHKHRVEEWFDEYEANDYSPYLRSVRQVYKEHGWPNLAVYKKKECLDSVAKLMEEHFDKDLY